MDHKKLEASGYVPGIQVTTEHDVLLYEDRFEDAGAAYPKNVNLEKGTNFLYMGTGKDSQGPRFWYHHVYDIEGQRNLYWMCHPSNFESFRSYFKVLD